MLGKIFKYILVILLGMVLGAGALAGAEYLIVTKTKVGTIKNSVPAIGEYVGDSLNDYTLIEAIQKLSASDTTIGQYTEYLPFLNDALESLAQNESVKKFVTLDLDKIKTLTFSQLGSDIASAISVTASLGSLSESFGFTLPDLPLFSTKETYVKITSEDFSVDNAYYKDKTEQIYYVGETGDYENAYADGNLLDAAREKELYFRSEGIMDIPVTDAVSSLSETLGDVKNMTIDDLNADFGVDLIGDNALVAKIVHGEDTLSSIAENFTSRIDALTLEEDLGIDLTGSVLENIVGETCTVGELKTMNFEEKIESLTLAELKIEIDETSLAGKILTSDTTIAQIKESGFIDGKVNELTLADLGVNVSEGGLMSKIVSPSSTVAELKSMDFEEKINSLTVGDLGLTVAEGSLTSKIISADTTVGEFKNMDIDAKVQALAIGDVIEISETSPAILRALRDTKLSELDGKVSELKIEEIVDVPEGEENLLLDALFRKNATVGNISSTMNALTVGDVYEIKGFIDASTILPEEEEIYKNFRWFTRSGDETAGYTYTECAEPTEAYGEGEYFKLDKDAGIWLLLMYEKSGTPDAYSYRETGDIRIVDLADTVQTGIKDNLEKSTLQELYEVGFLSAVPNKNIKNKTLKELIELSESFPNI